MKVIQQCPQLQFGFGIHRQSSRLETSQLRRCCQNAKFPESLKVIYGKDMICWSLVVLVRSY